MFGLRRSVAAGLFVTCASYVDAAAPSFTGLGHLPGGPSSGATAISSDGSTVVGWATSTDGPQAFRWRASTGMVGLGDLAGGDFYSDAWGVSADGSVIVGSGTTASGTEAFRWTAQGGMVGLGNLGGSVASSTAAAVSADGRVIVGYSKSPASGTDSVEAFRWSAETGMVGLGDLPGGDFRSAGRALTPDGSVIVGYGDTALGSEAFRWTAATGMVGLGHLAGPSMDSIAASVTPDGSVVVGMSDSSTGSFAFRWTASDGMTSLGDLPGGAPFSYANAVSADGSVVVGASDEGTFNRAFIWDAAHGMRSLRDVLVTDYGLPVGSWILQEASGISADGRTIVGMGKNPLGQSEAWVVTIPEPSTFLLFLGAATARLRCGRRRGRARLLPAKTAVDDEEIESLASACRRRCTSRGSAAGSRVLQLALVLAALFRIVRASHGATLMVYWNGNYVTGAPSVAIGNQYSPAPDLTILRPGSYRVYSVIDSTTPGDIGVIVVDYESGYSGSMDLQIWNDGVTPGAHNVTRVSTSSATYSWIPNLWISGSLGSLSVHRRKGDPADAGRAVFAGSGGQPGVGGDVGTIYADYLSTTIGGDVTGLISCREAYLTIKGSLVEDWSTKHAKIYLNDADDLGGSYNGGSIAIDGPGPNTGRIYVGAVNDSTCNPAEDRRHIGTVTIPNAEFVGWISSSDLTAGSMTVPSNWDIGFGQYSRINCAIINDPGAPTVTNVYSTTPNGTYNVGDTIAISVKFTHNVYVSGGSPTITLATGAVQRLASYDHGSGSRILVFTYTVQAGDASSDLDYASTGALTLASGATLKDNCDGGYQHDAVLTLPTPGAAGSLGANSSLVIDGVVPTVTINQAGGQADPTASSPINFTVVFSEPVTGFATGDVTVGGTAGAMTATVTETAPNDGTTFNVAVSGMTSDGMVVASIGAGVCTDPAGNSNTESSSTDDEVTFDTTAPAIQWTMPLDDSGIRALPSVRLMFAEPVSLAAGHDAGDLAVDGSSATSLLLSDGTTVTTSTPATAGPYVFSGFSEPGCCESVSVALASGAFTDAAGNVSAAGAWDYDFVTCHTPPQDADGDGDVDLTDFGKFQGCFNGPNRPWNATGDQTACACLDDDGDLDVDLTDFGVLQTCFNGPNLPPAPGCGGSLLMGGGGTFALLDNGGDADVLIPSGLLGEGGGEVVFSLHSPLAGQAVARGTAVPWQVNAVLNTVSPGLAQYVFDLELRSGNETGALAKVTIAPPEMLNPLSDESDTWWSCGPNGMTAGRLAGVGDAIPVPWFARFGEFAGGASSPSDDTGIALSAGSIDTSALAPGRYVLVIRPTSATVLRSDVPLPGDLTGNFAVRAIPAAGAGAVGFEVAE